MHDKLKLFKSKMHFHVDLDTSHALYQPIIIFNPKLFSINFQEGSKAKLLLNKEADRSPSNQDHLLQTFSW